MSAGKGSGDQSRLAIESATESRKVGNDMDTHVNANVNMEAAETRQMAGQLARWWWAWLVVGILWLVAGLVILQVREGSVALVGIIIGAMFLAAGVQELVIGAISEGWKWLWITFAILLIIGGLFALFNPVQTFTALASTLGFLFLMVGVLWTIEAFAARGANELWWLNLIAGIMMIGLGFWAEGQFFATKAYTLLIFAGVWALLHGVSDIIKSFQFKRLGAMAPQ